MTKSRDTIVFRPDVQNTNKSWYEKMYSGRSRTIELENGYLKNERKIVSEFVSEHSIQGPSLEIGCGVGLFAEVVPGFIGLEYSLSSLRIPGFENFSRISANAQWLPVKDESVEFVFSFNTLEHVPRIDLAFDEMDRVLKRGGYLLLRPAWHCTKYNTELIPILPYRQLNFRQKITKALLPILKSKLYKFLTRIPWRIWRRCSNLKERSLSWGKLTPYYGELWQNCMDSDATSSIDSHETILFYQRRGYECLSHKGIFRQVLAGHDIVILRKL